MGDKLTKTYIDHILLRLDKFIVGTGAIREKAADHYVTAVVILFEGQHDVEQSSFEKLIIDNRKFYGTVKMLSGNFYCPLIMLQSVKTSLIL